MPESIIAERQRVLKVLRSLEHEYPSKLSGTVYHTDDQSIHCRIKGKQRVFKIIPGKTFDIIQEVCNLIGEA